MANCNCAGSTGPTYATANRYGCLSSVPTSSGIPYNCFLPPTNMSYYQNYPFYNGPCGSTPGSSGTSGSGCNCPPPCCNPCCNSSDSEEESSSSSSEKPCGCNCFNPFGGCGKPCNKCCKPNVCCGPAVALASSSGAVTTTASGSIPLNLTATAADSNVPMPLANLTGPISVVGDNIVFNCPGTYLVLMTIALPTGTTYTGTIGMNLNGTPVASSVQNLAVTSNSYHGTSQALIRATEGSTLSVVTSAALTTTAPAAGSVINVSAVRVAC